MKTKETCQRYLDLQLPGVSWAKQLIARAGYVCAALSWADSTALFRETGLRLGT